MARAVRPKTESHPDGLLRAASTALSAALARLPREQQDAAWQEGLDLLATIADLKPVCLVGRGFAEPQWEAALRRIAMDAGLLLLEATPWFPAAGSSPFPDWYVAAATQRRATPVTYLCRDEATRDRAAALSSQRRVAAADEAALLGYPVCCVVQHHRQALALERLSIDMLARLARDDHDHMTRLVAAGVELLPATEDEQRRYASITAIAPSPATSVNMCDACAADPTSAAWSLSRRYQTLAAAVSYPES